MIRKWSLTVAMQSPRSPTTKSETITSVVRRLTIEASIHPAQPGQLY